MLTLYLDLQDQLVGNFYYGAVGLQLFTQRRQGVLRIRVFGFSDWLQVEYSSSGDWPSDGDVAMTQSVPIELVLRDSLTRKIRGRRTVFVTSGFFGALRLTLAENSAAMVEIATSKPISG
jgi:hypothetical protein